MLPGSQKFSESQAYLRACFKSFNAPKKEAELEQGSGGFQSFCSLLGSVLGFGGRCPVISRVGGGGEARPGCHSGWFSWVGRG